MSLLSQLLSLLSAVMMVAVIQRVEKLRVFVTKSGSGWLSRFCISANKLHNVCEMVGRIYEERSTRHPCHMLQCLAAMWLEQAAVTSTQVDGCSGDTDEQSIISVLLVVLS